MTMQDEIPLSEPPEADAPQAGVSRRGFLRGLTGTIAGAAVGGTLLADDAEAQIKGDAPTALSGMVLVALTVNGKKRAATVDLRRTLLEMLRTDFNLTGAKQVCNHGSCGGCTVHLDGKPVYSCMTLAVDCENRKVDTVEGNGKR